MKMTSMMNKRQHHNYYVYRDLGVQAQCYHPELKILNKWDHY